MSSKKQQYFDTARIFENYLCVRDNFEGINKAIKCQRDIFNDQVIENLMLSMNFLNERLARGGKSNFLDPGEMLELNAIVHLGRGFESRKQFKGFLKQTEDKFNKYYPYLREWYQRHEKNHDDPYKIAAGIYVRILAAPQLFEDGNHRTGALAANYYLLKRGEKPFVLTRENAVEFFNLASDVKFKKRDLSSQFKRAVGWRDEMHHMRDFLRSSARSFVCVDMNGWEAPKPADGKPKKDNGSMPAP